LANERSRAAKASDACTLEIALGETWQTIGEVRVADAGRGIPSSARFEYDFAYLDAMADAIGVRDLRAVSCRYPVNYDAADEACWPPFLLDLIPSGAARRHWEGQLGVPNKDSSDWEVLRSGATNPPGNVRVASAESPQADHPGFPRSAILDRADTFIEYAYASGAPVSGSSGAGGDSPKFLLREDHAGQWHADGALADTKTKESWLVKFPRTRDQVDRLVLEAEAGYLDVARHLGVNTYRALSWERDCLFVPRFDRAVVAGSVRRFGMESLCSLAGVAEFGLPIPKATLADALARCSTNRAADLREFLLRDVLDVALGNTDNHARNTSVLKREDGSIRLAPLYDFAPMIFDPRGVARVCRWEDRADFPEWSGVADTLDRFGLAAEDSRRFLRELAAPIAQLPQTMRACHVPQQVVERCRPRIERVAKDLEAVKP